MKDSGSGGGIGGDMTSAVGDRPPLLPSSSHHHHHHHNNNNNHHHDHRENRRAAGGGEVGEGVGVGAWRTMPSRGADINLLANSLTSRLRKSSPSSRHKAGATTSSSSGIPPSSTTTTTTTITSSGSRSAPPEDSVRKSKTTTTTTTSKSTRDSSGPHVPQSILKRTVSRETAEQQQQQRPGSRSPPEDLHLPDVFLTHRWSSSAGHLPGYHHNAGNGAAGDVVGEGVEEEAFNNQFLDRPSPALAILRGRRGEGGGGGGGGGGFFSTAQARNGQVTWVKRAGIFQPADKYAPGRQTLHGEDQPYGFSQPVDYETLTLSSRTDSPDSDVTSGWSSSHGASRRKGLKVSWKPHSDSETEGEREREGEGEGGNTTPRSWRQRSAGTAQSEAYSFVKPKFHPGKSRVPVVGVKWKVPTPVVGRPPPADGVTEDGGRAPPFSSSTTTTSSHSAPASGDSSSSSASSSSLSAAQRFPSSGKPAPNNTRDVRHHHHHPWRALHVRDVHPMTTAMEREGTSVSKTKWRVPSVRPVPAYTFIEDLMEAAGHHHHWHPVTGPVRLPTRTTLDAHSVQQRVKDGASLASKDTAGTATTVSNLTDQGPPESSCQS
ncbi:uncharacterized protein LOC143296077 [Babylonia areolata]|uniref:uncharacterized protein LOC143296077 n=1 Tax=Babylonia areolata TaxID=304850 RepID=UPI003FCFA18A